MLLSVICCNNCRLIKRRYLAISCHRQQPAMCCQHVHTLNIVHIALHVPGSKSVHCETTKGAQCRMFNRPSVIFCAEFSCHGYAGIDGCVTISHLLSAFCMTLPIRCVTTMLTIAKKPASSVDYNLQVLIVCASSESYGVSS